MWMRVFYLCLVALSLAPATAQVCGPGEVLLKNDNLPNVPSGATPVAIIRGLCEGEGAAAIFDLSAYPAGVRINTAAVGYFSPPPVSGLQASVNLQIYDGVSFSPTGIPSFGPLIFDLNQIGGSLGVSSSGINTVDLSASNLVATSNRLVVAFTMQVQAAGAGSCAAGYTTNFGTDGTTGGACSSIPQRNLIFIQGQGWRDNRLAAVSSFGINVPLCPIFLNGNWIIRACVEPIAPPNALRVTYTPPSPVSSGSIVLASFLSNASFAGDLYLAVPSSTANPPGSPLPFPLTDPLVQLALANDPFIASIFSNTSGFLSPAGSGGGVIILPSLPPAALPLTLYMAFATFDPSGSPLTGLSDAAPLVVQ